MTKEAIRKRLQAQPFIPFKVKVAGGGEFLIPSGDHAHLHPNGRILFVHQDHAGTEIIDVGLVSSSNVPETV